MPSPERGSGRPHYPYHYPNRPVFACSGAFRNLRLYSVLPPFPTESRQHETTAQRVPLEALHGIDTMNSDELRSPTAFGSGATVTQSPAHGQGDDLDSLLNRINKLASGEGVPETPPQTASHAPPRSQSSAPPPQANRQTIVDRPNRETTVEGAPTVHLALANHEEEKGTNQWYPQEPETLQDAGISEAQLEQLALRYLGSCGDMSGHQLSEQHAIPFRLIEPVLAGLKQAQLVAFRGSAPMNDYVYQLTELGRESAKKLTEICSYFGAAPVQLEAYVDSVSQQTLTADRKSVV